MVSIKIAREPTIPMTLVDGEPGIHMQVDDVAFELKLSEAKSMVEMLHLPIGIAEKEMTKRFGPGLITLLEPQNDGE